MFPREGEPECYSEEENTQKVTPPRKGRGLNNMSMILTEDQTVTHESPKDKEEWHLQFSGFSERGVPENWARYGYSNYQVFATWGSSAETKHCKF